MTTRLQFVPDPAAPSIIDKDWRFNNFPTCRVGLYNHGIDQRAGPVVIQPCPTAPRSNRRCARSTTRSPRRTDAATPPSRSPSSGTEAPNTSPPCSSALAIMLLMRGRGQGPPGVTVVIGSHPPPHLMAP